MCLWIQFFFVLALFFDFVGVIPGLALGDFHHGTFTAEAGSATYTCSCAASVVFTSQRPSTIACRISRTDSQSPFDPPLQGSSFSCPSFERNVSAEAYAVAVPVLPENGKPVHAPLCLVRTKMARSDGYVVSTSDSSIWEESTEPCTYSSWTRTATSRTRASADTAQAFSQREEESGAAECTARGCSSLGTCCLTLLYPPGNWQTSSIPGPYAVPHVQGPSAFVQHAVAPPPPPPPPPVPCAPNMPPEQMWQQQMQQMPVLSGLSAPPVDSRFGAAVSEAVARSSFVFCNSVSADRIVVAASRLLGAAAACVILLQLNIVNRIGVAASRLR